jgi:hypothetical protein
MNGVHLRIQAETQPALGHDVANNQRRPLISPPLLSAPTQRCSCGQLSTLRDRPAEFEARWSPTSDPSPAISGNRLGYLHHLSDNERCPKSLRVFGEEGDS